MESNKDELETLSSIQKLKAIGSLMLQVNENQPITLSPGILNSLGLEIVENCEIIYNNI